MNQETSERVRIFAARTILTMNPCLLYTSDAADE